MVAGGGAPEGGEGGKGGGQGGEREEGGEDEGGESEGGALGLLALDGGCGVGGGGGGDDEEGGREGGHTVKRPRDMVPTNLEASIVGRDMLGYDRYRDVKI